MLLDTDIYCAQVLREIIPVVAQVQNGTNNKYRIITRKIVLTMCHILTMHHYSNSCILYTWCPKQTMVMARCGQGWAGQAQQCDATKLFQLSTIL